MFTNTEKRIKCQFNGTKCSKVSTIAMQVGKCLANPCDGGCLAFVCADCCVDYKNNNLPFQ